MAKEGTTVIGVPYYAGQNPYQAGIVPPNAIYGDPLGAPIQQTIYRDTPAPFNCLYCGNTGLTNLRSKPGVAAVVACMMPFMLGFCFLCPSMDCLWNKQHHCPQCGNKVLLYVFFMPATRVFFFFLCMEDCFIHMIDLFTGC
ncbi:LPS-induced tumor necrosis factor alpha factor [Arabidopsis suecica]|uniref:LPS-induced tumor necrosis factor alpha factor n=1 Tax=Arabidopsis suecica TaxID=45249 RepID=A0A8T2DIB3_ARASU|nr:LPS-induced tumor necrosis factor alpha factor [Arabidopsis suecica]